jgi:hypothetical protein
MRIVKKYGKNARSFVYEIMVYNNTLYVLSVLSVEKKKGFETFEIINEGKYVIVSVGEEKSIEVLGEIPEKEELAKTLMIFLETEKTMKIDEYERKIAEILVVYLLEKIPVKYFIIGRKLTV